MVSFAISQHRFSLWIGAEFATSHYLNRWYLDHWRRMASLGHNEFSCSWWLYSRSIKLFNPIFQVQLFEESMSNSNWSYWSIISCFHVFGVTNVLLHNHKKQMFFHRFIHWSRVPHIYVNGLGHFRFKDQGSGLSPVHRRIWHDDIMKWETFPRYWSYCEGNPPVTSGFPPRSQWRGTLIFSLICAWTNGSANNRDAGAGFETPSLTLWRHCDGRNLNQNASLILQSFLLSHTSFLRINHSLWRISIGGVVTNLSKTTMRVNGDGLKDIAFMFKNI